jgi:predicted AlkP superfamily phosphohydrolase/phosphomutase
MTKKTFIIGLDCAEPGLVFDKYKDKLPNIASLIDKGFSAPMRSTDPPITVPAWSAMMSGKSPGALGLYGFRNRQNYNYNQLALADSGQMKEPRLWDLMTKAGKTSIVIGVPQTYPVKPLKGYMVSGIMTPSMEKEFTFPKWLKDDLMRIAPDYMIDADDFRTENKERLLKDIYNMTRARFKFIRYMLETRRWDFFMFVEIGLDRIQHAFWHYQAVDSRDYVKGNRYEKAVLKYYQYLDFEIGTLLKRLDNTTDVIIVSDHGAKTMMGGVCFNEWLIKEGYLVLKAQPRQSVKLSSKMVDWNKTRAWAEGGYYGRCFINVKGREPKGIVPAKEYDALRDELKSKIESMKDESGADIGNQVFKPQELYRRINGIPPDLLVYFSGLSRRSIGNVGMNTIFTFKSGIGPDGANHARNGVFIIKGENIKPEKKELINILDVVPTVLKRMGMSVPEDVGGGVIDLVFG